MYENVLRGRKIFLFGEDGVGRGRLSGDLVVLAKLN